MRLAEILKNKFDMSLSIAVPEGTKIDAKEKQASEMIPYTVHFDDETVITKDDGLVQVIKLDGLYFESLSAAQIKQFERRRNTILRSIANSDRGIYVHLIRRKFNKYPDGEGSTYFSKLFNAAYHKRYDKRSFFVNDIYISVVCNRFRQGAPGILDRLFNVISAKKENQEDLYAFDKQAKEINEVTKLLVQTLAEYGARKLSIQRHPNFESEQVSSAEAKKAVIRFEMSWNEFQKTYGDCKQYNKDEVLDFIGSEFTELGEFFNYLINLRKDRIAVSELPLDQTLASSWLDFNMIGNVMAVENLHETRAAAVLSMAEWPESTSSRMLDDFLKQPVEFILTQSFFYTDRISAESDMRKEKRRLKVNDQEGTSEEDQEELVKGLQDLARGRSVTGMHHLTMLVHVAQASHLESALENKNQTISDLNDAIGMLKKSFVNLGVKPVRERFALEMFFWAQLAGQPQVFMNGRRGKIKSSNFAGFASLHNFATGKLDGNLWGSAIMPLETESGTAYYLNLHREMEGMVAGHTAFTADTGSGKTLLMAAIIAMLDKANPSVYWFDNREGAKTFMCAMGGRHLTLSSQGTTGWNPFRLPDTEDNRIYLVELLSLMRTCYGGEISPDDIERFKKAVVGNYSLKPSERRLRNIAWHFGNGALKKDMSVWHSDGINSGVFDNEDDNINLSECRYYCYEMRQLIKDGEARAELPVILSYIFHRIEAAMNGKPFIIVLEEGQNLVKTEYWRQKIDSYIMQIRRKNGVIIFVTPDAKYLHSPTDSIQKQTVTKFFLPNDKADYHDYVEKLGLTQAEFDFVRETPVSSRTFLIRRGNESIKAKFDLSDMPEFIPVLSSNDKGVELMHKIIDELGTNEPEKWLPIFMQRALEEDTHNLRKGSN